MHVATPALTIRMVHASETMRASRDLREREIKKRDEGEFREICEICVRPKLAMKELSVK